MLATWLTQGAGHLIGARREGLAEGSGSWLHKQEDLTVIELAPPR